MKPNFNKPISTDPTGGNTAGVAMAIPTQHELLDMDLLFQADELFEAELAKLEEQYAGFVTHNSLKGLNKRRKS